MRDLLVAVEKTVSIGETLGADEVEAYASSIDSRKIVLTSGMENFQVHHTVGLGVRVIVDNKIGFYATSSIAMGEIKRAVERAYRIAKHSDQDKDWVSLPVKIGRKEVQQTFDKEMAFIEPSTLVEEAVGMVNAVHNEGMNLSVVGGEIYVENAETAIANSHNCDMERKETFSSAEISVKAEDAGKKGISSESQQKRVWKELDCLSIAQLAAKRASKIVLAEQMTGGKMPIVWRNKLFAAVLRIMFGGTLSADSVQKERSPWAGKVGRSIASENFNLVDDGIMRAGLKTREFDDEGIPQQRVKLIDRGILQDFLYDTYTGNKEGRESTGNASRNYRSTPRPSPNNLILNSGRQKVEELFKDVSRGVYIIEAIGAWLSNPISGDLSATATNAFLIEKGELIKPVKGIIVSGNFFDILSSKIEIIANDLQNFGSTYSPSVRVSEMSIIGK